jgi:beta-lactamase regulating signal transducer with metallopeptidase domain
MNPSIDLLGSALILLALHATALLALVWLIERLGGLKHPGWAEFAWRAALFGAFFSVAFELTSAREYETAALPASHEAAMATPHREDDAANVAAATAMTQSLSTASSPTQPSPTASAAIDNAARASLGTTSTQAKTNAGTEEAVMSTPGVSRIRTAWEFDAGRLATLMLAWAFGALLSALWVLRQIISLRSWKRRMRRRYTSASTELEALVAQLATRMRVRTPRLHIVSDLAGPLVFSNTVLLPAWAEGLDRTQQTAMLAHELAHLRRRDPVWRLLQRIALIPLFFHPLAWLAVRRLEGLAETLCDRAAVESSGSPRALAECLAECLARQTERRNPIFAVAMAEHSGGIVGRVRQLLETSPMTFAAIPKSLRWGAALLVLIGLIALPGVMIVARNHNENLSITYRNGTQTYQMRSSLPVPGNRLRMNAEGEIEFDPRETDVVRLGPKASFEIEGTRGRVTREIRIVGKNGRIVRDYKVDGVTHAFDAEGRAWLATQIPAFYRLSGFQADQRTKRLLGEGGVARVLSEIDQIDADGVRAEYIGQLFAQAALDESQYVQVLARIERLESDFEKARVLDAALKQDAPVYNHRRRLLAIAADIGSDFERAEWLSQAAAKFELIDAEQAQWLTTLNAFDSDFDRRRTLERMIEVGRPQEAALALALQSALGLDSDFDRRSVLEKAAAGSVAVVDTDFFPVVDGIDSDFEKREALLALIRNAIPSRERSAAILRSVGGMESEFERGVVLEALAEKMPNDPELIRAYRALTREMSDHERGAAERALDRFASR